MNASYTCEHCKRTFPLLARFTGQVEDAFTVSRVLEIVSVGSRLASIYCRFVASLMLVDEEEVSHGVHVLQDVATRTASGITGDECCRMSPRRVLYGRQAVSTSLKTDALG